jgi:hypothetical protein
MKNYLFAALISMYTLPAFASLKDEAKEGCTRQNAVAADSSKPFSAQNKKTYCSPFAQTKYKVQITKNKIRITRLYKEYKEVITGLIKGGKIYSNDPGEKDFKPVSGRYYKLGKDSFSVLNIENGEYEQFTLCKE